MRLLIDSINNDNKDILEPSKAVGVQAKLRVTRLFDKRYWGKLVGRNVFSIANTYVESSIILANSKCILESLVSSG